MNTPNNRRRRESREKMEGVFVRLLQDRQLEEITVTDICKGAQVNRTTFYANYQDIYGLADAVRSRLQQEVWGLFGEQNAENLNDPFLTLFRHIRENQLFYKTWFKLERNEDFSLLGEEIVRHTERQGQIYYENRYMEYHIAFFRSGLNAIIKLWLENGCREEPEEIVSVLKAEYRPKGDHAWP